MLSLFFCLQLINAQKVPFLACTDNIENQPIHHHEHPHEHHYPIQQINVMHATIQNVSKDVHIKSPF